MFDKLLASRRELKRLAMSDKFWRGRCLRLEAKIEHLQSELLETHRSFTDRVLTGVLKTPAVGDQIKRNSGSETVDEAFDSGLKAHLEAKRESLQEHAAEAGKSSADVELMFHERRADYIADFEQGFN